MAIPKRVRVGVLGAGAWARFAHLPGYKREARCDLVAIADPVVERAREFAAEAGLSTGTLYKCDALEREGGVLALVDWRGRPRMAQWFRKGERRGWILFDGLSAANPHASIQQLHGAVLAEAQRRGWAWPGAAVTVRRRLKRRAELAAAAYRPPVSSN